MQLKSTPKAKRKRKRSDLSSQSTTTAVASTSPSHLLKMPPSKRAKTRQTYSTTTFKKHPTHWELDGNTLVQIKNVRFKLQRSRLSRHGEWFKHTFEQGDSAPELHEDGVLHLDRLDVSVRDFTALLDAMDDAMQVPFCFPHNKNS